MLLADAELRSFVVGYTIVLEVGGSPDDWLTGLLKLMEKKGDLEHSEELARHYARGPVQDHGILKAADDNLRGPG